MNSIKKEDNWEDIEATMKEAAETPIPTKRTSGQKAMDDRKDGILNKRNSGASQEHERTPQQKTK